MSAELHNNLDPKIAQHLDNRLITVSSVASLPDPTVASNFLYEGALAYVGGAVDSFYKCVMDITNTFLEWQSLLISGLSIGTINITPGTTVLDLSLVSPSISDCYAVQINIVGGTSATIQSITNFPGSDTLLTFSVTSGQSVIFKHVDYDVATTDQIVLEIGFDMTLKGRSIGNESLTLKKHGVVNCQWDAVQFVKNTEWVQNLLSQTVVNDLVSTSTIFPLSAYQGNLLNAMIQIKQDQLIAGTKISLVPATGNATISVIPKDWLLVILSSSPSISANTLTYITSVMGSSVSNDYRYVDLRLNPWQAGGDRGMWLLPPSKNSNLAGNWVCIDNPVATKVNCLFPYASEAALNLALISNKYYPKVLTNSGTGLTTGISFNIDGISGQKTSTKFGVVGYYKVDYDIIITVNDTTARRFDAEFFLTDGVQVATNPANTGVLQRTVSSSEATANTSGRRVRIQGSFSFNVSSLGTDDTFTIAISEAANNFTNCVIAANNSIVQITKHS